MKDSSRESGVTWKTILVSLLCLLGAGAGGYYLYFDLNEAGVIGIGTPVGKIERRESQVRRKASNSFVWTNVQVSENLYKKDSIQTGRGSAVSVRLEDGAILDIAENSLVVMDNTSDLSLGFLRGSMVVRKADGDSKISVGKDGKQKVEQLAVRLIKPESMSRYFVSGRDLKQVHFQWEPRLRNGTDIFTVQVSKDKRFLPQFTKSLTSNDPKIHSVRESLSSGKYYWRVLGKGNPITEIREFRVLSATPLQAVWPANLQKITSETPIALVQFRWLTPKILGVEEVDVSQGEHRIEVARESEFKTVILSDAINPVTGRTTVTHIPEGIVYWRIRSKYGDFNAISGAKAFEFKKFIKAPEQPKVLPLPIEAKPEYGTIFNLITKNPPLEASWSEVPGAEEYEVTIYGEAVANSPRKVVFKTQTSQRKIDLTQLKPGVYYWTLRAIDKQKRPGTPLPLRKFSTSYGDLLAPPQVVSPEVQ